MLRSSDKKREPTAQWSCKCGDVQAHLTGEPFVIFNCVCRSCVSACRFIEQKTNQSGTSMMDSKDLGVCVAGYGARQVTFPNSMANKLKHVRVGEKGVKHRAYTTCCGTQMTNICFPGLIVFNRNGIQRIDGSPYEFGKEDTVLSANTNYCFEEDSQRINSPSHKTLPISFMSRFAIRFVDGLANPFSPKMTVYPELFPTQEESEVSPITW